MVLGQTKLQKFWALIYSLVPKDGRNHAARSLHNIIVILSFIQDLSKQLCGENIGRLVAVKCDVSVEEEVKAAFEKAKTEFGGVDVCINNAGLAHNAPLLSGATSEWKSMLDVSFHLLWMHVCGNA